MSTLDQQNRIIFRAAVVSRETCACGDPIPVHRAERKGAALTICLRCGLRMPARLR
jgi:hypothetical protein